MPVEKDLRNLNGRINALQAMQAGTPAPGTGVNIVTAGAIKAKGLIQANWDAAKGADGKPMKKLTSRYARKKAAAGRRPEPNLQFRGDLKRGFTVRPRGAKALITFRGGEMPKARGNYANRPNMMQVGKRIRRKVINFALKLIQATKGAKDG